MARRSRASGQKLEGARCADIIFVYDNRYIIDIPQLLLPENNQ